MSGHHPWPPPTKKQGETLYQIGSRRVSEAEYRRWREEGCPVPSMSPLEIRKRLPQPGCVLGYTLDEVEMILTQTYWNPRMYSSTEAIEHRRFEKWMTGQTMAICEGRTVFAQSCTRPHGTIIYRHDLERYLAGLPVVD